MKSVNKELLAMPAFRRLLIARTISNFGNGLSPVAVAFGVLSLEGATAKSLSLVMAFHLAPLVVFMLFGGIIADRFPRALVVGTTDIFLSVAIITNGLMLVNGLASVKSFIVVALIGGTLNALWWPAFSGIVPEIVDENHLQPANGFVGLVSNSANIIGAVTGGIIVAAVGAGIAIVIDGVTFLVAGVLVLQLRKFGTKRENNEHSPSVFDDLIHGWKEFSSRKWIVTIVAGYSIIAMLFESGFSVVGPVFAKESLGGPKPWSWILASLSIGMATGVFVTMKVKPKFPLIVGLLVQFGMVAWFLSMGFTMSIALAMITAFVCGFGMDFFMVLWQTALQTEVPNEALSRVSSYDAFGSLFFAPLGLVIAGPIVTRVGAQTTFQIYGAIMAAVIFAMLSVKDVRNLESKKLAEAS
jgi:MFS family permease